ncbi:DUF6542 domain-containing protein [Umezawaea beigongshangensis]|uniref:DUF6542 domain-containing protein n=1 Tax=Umezawaea beigongshangensis TaxID=2780383 RepID=UPI0018F10D60|nr:DUF6542 domain-containing protein [Umezawaea beigongshangensis]
MTATRDRRDDLDGEPEIRWNDRAIAGDFRGLKWWIAVLGAFALTIVGTLVDVGSDAKTVGWTFTITFFTGCVAAVCLVQRRSMFGPVVQPPLVLAIVVPLVVLLTQDVLGGKLGTAALALGTPLIDGFPTMAVTTIFTVAIGAARVFLQRDPNRVTKDERREAAADRKRVRATDDEEERPRKRPSAGRRPTRPVADEDAPAERRSVSERRRPARPADEESPSPRTSRRPAGERRTRQEPPGRGGSRPAQPRRRPRED